MAKIIVIRERLDGRLHKFFGGAGMDPRFMTLVRAWTRKGVPVITAEAMYGDGMLSGKRFVFDLRTGYTRAGLMCERIWFWGRIFPHYGGLCRLVEDTHDLAGARVWWGRETGKTFR